MTPNFKSLHKLSLKLYLEMNLGRSITLKCASCGIISIKFCAQIAWFHQMQISTFFGNLIRKGLVICVAKVATQNMPFDGPKLKLDLDYWVNILNNNYFNYENLAFLSNFRLKLFRSLKHGTFPHDFPYKCTGIWNQFLQIFSKGC